ncbi:MAG: RidA family protein [Candidatus Micrarchaeota archaeon]|nr:RidA family protein [Candidatus Micrarchaeota archaeon]
MVRKNITYGQPLEKEIGFARAVRIGNMIAVSGTAPISKDGSVYAPGDVYGQAKRCLEIIDDVIVRSGGKLANVIRTRIFLKNIKKWKEAARAHGEYFSEIQPTCTFVEVSGFINPDWLIEIEADVVLEDPQV